MVPHDMNPGREMDDRLDPVEQRPPVGIGTDVADDVPAGLADRVAPHRQAGYQRTTDEPTGPGDQYGHRRIHWIKATTTTIAAASAGQGWTNANTANTINARLAPATAALTTPWSRPCRTACW